MKKHPIYHRILLTCALLLGSLGLPRADVPNARVLPPNPGPRIEKETGFFSRLFGHLAERMDRDDDDDDDDKRVRPRSPKTQFPRPAAGTTIITTTTTTKRTPFHSQPPDENRNPRVQPEIDVAMATTRIVVVPSTVQAPPASKQIPVSPPRSTALAPSDVRNDPLSVQQQVQNAPSAFLRFDPASRDPRVLPPGPGTPFPLSSSFADQGPVAVTHAQGQHPADSLRADQPAPPPMLPFGTPVPGRRGLVYPPGQEATPENMIDVTGYAPGTKVRDPVSKQVFRVP